MSKPEEQAKLLEEEGILDEMVETFPELDRRTALKFCLARKFQVSRVKDLYKNYLETIERYDLQNVGIVDVLDDLKAMKMYVPGTRGRDGSAIFIISVARHFSNPTDNKRVRMLAFYLTEYTTANEKTQRLGITIIFDFRDVTWSEFEISYVVGLIQLFQNNIPASVKNILVYRAPWWIRMSIGIVAQFMKEKMKKRICMCEEPEELVAFVEPEQLPTEFNGLFQYDHEYFIKRELGRLSEGTFYGKPEGDIEISEKIQDLLENDGFEFEQSGELLVESEDEKKLQSEREAKIIEIDGEIEKLKERHDACELYYPIPLHDMLSNRATRLSLDVSAAQSFQWVWRTCEDEDSREVPERADRSEEKLIEAWNEIKGEEGQETKVRKLSEAIITLQNIQLEGARRMTESDIFMKKKISQI